MKDESDRLAFLAAIEAAPWDEELPRLVYADWLDEHGEHEEADRQRKYVPAERWLRGFAEQIIDHATFDPMTYETLMAAADSYLETGSFYDLYLDRMEEVNARKDVFWDKYEIVTGMLVPDRARERMFFTCFC